MKFAIKAVALATLATLAACGGGGDDPAPTPVVVPHPTEGAYQGDIHTPGNNAFEMLVLENGEFYALYGNKSATTFAVNGGMHGSLWTGQAQDFGYTPAQTTQVQVFHFDPATKQIGARVGGNPDFYGANAGPIVGSSYEYNTPASLAAVAGTWALATSNRTTTFVNVTGGDIGGSDSGCPFAGTIRPRPSGKNVFDVALTFAPSSDCLLPGQTVTGIALTYPEGGKQQLLVTLTDGAQRFGLAALGSR